VTKTGHSHFALKVVDIDFLETVNQSARSIFGRDFNIHFARKRNNDKSRDQYSLNICCSQFGAWLVSETNKKSFVPQSIKSSSASCKRAFFQGLMDSEGSIQRRRINNDGRVIGGSKVQFSVKSDWIFDVHTIAKQLEIHTSNITTGSGQYRFYMTPISYKEAGLGFSIQRKQDILDEELMPRKRKPTVFLSKRKFKPGVHPGRNTVTEDVVLQIRGLFLSGKTNREIADITKISYYNIYRITSNKTYTNLACAHSEKCQPDLEE